MARVVVIGGTGHVGTFLVPRLVRAGHEVIVVSRGAAKPYQADHTWQWVRMEALDRTALEADGKFGTAIAALAPDIVIDMICFSLASAEQLVAALHGKVDHFLHTGTIWTHGHSTVVPTPEEAPKRPFGDYGTQKAQIEAFLLQQAHRHGFPATILHPGHIVGPGWAPLNPAGHFNIAAFATIARGEVLNLPNFGMETVHHIHADDIAALFMQAIARRSVAVGESFHVVSSGAITLRGYAEAMAHWFGVEPNLAFLPYADWAKTVAPEDAAATHEHIARSPNCSIEKARRLLGYEPRYTSLQAVQDAVQWLIDAGELVI